MSEIIVGTDGKEGWWLTGIEIVRCRDCAWGRKSWNGKRSAFIDGLMCGYRGGSEVKPSDFCSRGERREK